MKSLKIYISCLVITIAYSFVLPKDGEKFNSDKYNEIIYAGYSSSQKKTILTKKSVLACKFKSMNRKKTKKYKSKDLVIKN